MKLAASNIAWPIGADAEAADILLKYGATAVELAPGKVWSNPTDTTVAEAEAVRRWWEDSGLRIVAFQALVFGRPDLRIFHDEQTRDHFADYLLKIIRLASNVGVKPLVFGSPKNRAVEMIPRAEAWSIAIDFFRRVGAIAASHGTMIGLEHIPPEYGCDFGNTVAEATELVCEVNSPGFGLHLDAAGMAMTNDNVLSVGSVMPIHFHVSEPHMKPIGDTGAVPHNAFANQLKHIGYDGWVSIEVREPVANWQAALERSLIAARAAYGT